jgi:hypothetical protein
LKKWSSSKRTKNYRTKTVIFSKRKHVSWLATKGKIRERIITACATEKKKGLSFPLFSRLLSFTSHEFPSPSSRQEKGRDSKPRVFAMPIAYLELS